MKPEAKQYMRNMAIASVLYVAAVLAINLIDDNFILATPVRVLMSLLPVLPAIGMLVAMVIFVRSMDEFQRRVISEATLIAAIVVGLGTFTYGFIQGALDWPDIPTIWIMPALIAIQGVASFIVRKWYQ